MRQNAFIQQPPFRSRSGDILDIVLQLVRRTRHAREVRCDLLRRGACCSLMEPVVSMDFEMSSTARFISFSVT